MEWSFAVLPVPPIPTCSSSRRRSRAVRCGAESASRWLVSASLSFSTNIPHYPRRRRGLSRRIVHRATFVRRPFGISAGEAASLLRCFVHLPLARWAWAAVSSFKRPAGRPASTRPFGGLVGSFSQLCELAHSPSVPQPGPAWPTLHLAGRAGQPTDGRRVNGPPRIRASHE